MKNLLTLVFCILISIANVYSQATWRALPGAPKSHRVDDIYFLTPQKGWATNPYYSYLPPIQFGRIFTTNDGGQTWTQLVDSSTTFFRSIGFADNLHGWVGNLGESTPDTNFMYQTSDGGISWQPVTNVMGPKPKGICGISIVNDSVIYAYGRYSGSPVLMKTTNRGLSWISQDMSAYAQGLVDGYFINKDTGFITGSYDTSNKALILSTFNGGATWQVRQQSTRKHEIVWKIIFPSRTVGYASVESGVNETSGTPPDTTYFLKTTDGGLTWQEHIFKTGGFYELQGIGFLNDSVGWIGGHWNGGNYKTTDGGLTWAVDPSFGVIIPPYNPFGHTGTSMNRFRRFGDSLMYASGNTVYKYSINPAGVVTVKNNLADVKVYPNPFTDHLEVSFTAYGNVGNPMLSVYNMAGQVLLKDQPVKPGTNRYAMPRSLSPGQYLFRIRNADQELAAGTLTYQ